MTLLLKKLSISIKIHAVKPLLTLFGSISKLSTESVGSRRELDTNVFTPPTPMRRDATVESRRWCVLDIRLMSHGPETVVISRRRISSAVFIPYASGKKVSGARNKDKHRKLQS